MSRGRQMYTLLLIFYTTAGIHSDSSLSFSSIENCEMARDKVGTISKYYLKVEPLCIYQTK